MIVRDSAFGIDGLTRPAIKDIFDRTVQRVEGDKPEGRERALWMGQVALKTEGYLPTSSDIGIINHPATRPKWRNKDDIDTRPEVYPRVDAMNEPALQLFIDGVINLIPRETMPNPTTVGLNLFRTHGKVLNSGRHQDNEMYAVTYVVDVQGNDKNLGAVSSLYRWDRFDQRFSDRETVRRRLRPGEILIFKDSQYEHDVTAINPDATGFSQRDAVIMTVNYQNSYELVVPNYPFYNPNFKNGIYSIAI